MYPLKFLFINRFTKNKMHTVPLHASNRHLRGNFAQSHRSGSRSLQKSRKTVYPLKFLFINRFTTKQNAYRSSPRQQSAPPRKFCFFRNRLINKFFRGMASRKIKSRKTRVPCKCSLDPPVKRSSSPEPPIGHPLRSIQIRRDFEVGKMGVGLHRGVAQHILG